MPDIRVTLGVAPFLANSKALLSLSGLGAPRTQLLQSRSGSSAER